MPQYTVDVTSPDGRILEVDVNASSPREAKRLANNHIVAQYEKMENLDTTSNFDYSFEGQDPGTLGATMIAMGRTGDKILTGVNDLFASKEEKERIKAEQRAADSAYAPVAEQYPVSTFIGEAIPYMTPVGGGMRATVAAQTALGGVGYEEDAVDQVGNAFLSGGLSALPYGVGKLTNKMRSGPSTQVVGRGPSQSVIPTPSSSTPEFNLMDPAAAGRSRSVTPRLVERADELGYKLTPGQRTGSETLMKLEEGLASYPWTAGPYDRMRFDNQRLLNREAGKTIGMNTDAVTDEVLDTAHTAISNTFDDLTSKGEIEISNNIFDKMVDVVDEAREGIFGAGDVEKVIDDILSKAQDGKLTSEQYQRFSSQLTKKIKSLFKGEQSNPDLAFQLGDVKKILDDAVEESLGGRDLAMFKEARKAWKNLMTLERPGILAPETGDVSPRMLRNFLNRTDKAGYMRGRNQSDFYDVVRMGQQFRSPIGDSGTATRMAAQNMIRDAAKVYPIIPGVAANLANKAYLASPEIGSALMKNQRLGRLASGAASVYMDRPEDELERRGYR